MHDQGTTAPGLRDVLAEDLRRERDAFDQPTDVNEELDAALAHVNGAMVTLRATGDCLRRAASGLPETPFTGTQSRRYHSLIYGTAAAIAALDEALHHARGGD